VTVFLLVHPPLLGPGVWSLGAELLRGEGHRVEVPDLRPATQVSVGWWDRAADECAGHVASGGAVVVAHSGAGVLVPLVCRRAAASAAVLVDAVMPSQAGTTTPSARLRELVSSLPSESGLLPPWSAWWTDEQLVDVLPQEDLRTLLVAEEPRLRVDFYDQAVPVPEGWEPSVLGYLRLSHAYDDDAREARRRGWRVSVEEGGHLDPLRRPSQVINGVLGLLDGVRGLR
jgi:hypothetical protein